MEKEFEIKNIKLFWIISSIVYILVFTAILIIADMGYLPVKLLQKIPFYDIIGHFILYGILSIVLSEFFIKKNINIFYIKLPVFLLFLIIFTVVEEITQFFISHRTFSLFDLTASMTGIIVFYYVFKLVKIEIIKKFK